jgi:hypothetical protein
MTQVKYKLVGKNIITVIKSQNYIETSIALNLIFF